MKLVLVFVFGTLLSTSAFAQMGCCWYDDGKTLVPKMTACQTTQNQCINQAGYALWSPAGSPPNPAKGIYGACECPGGMGGGNNGQYGEIQCREPNQVVPMPPEECRHKRGTVLPNEQCCIGEGQHGGGSDHGRGGKGRGGRP